MNSVGAPHPANGTLKPPAGVCVCVCAVVSSCISDSTVCVEVFEFKLLHTPVHPHRCFHLLCLIGPLCIGVGWDWHVNVKTLTFSPPASSVYSGVRRGVSWSIQFFQQKHFKCSFFVGFRCLCTFRSDFQASEMRAAAAKKYKVCIRMGGTQWKHWQIIDASLILLKFLTPVLNKWGGISEEPWMRTHKGSLPIRLSAECHDVEIHWHQIFSLSLSMYSRWDARKRCKLGPLTMAAVNEYSCDIRRAADTYFLMKKTETRTEGQEAWVIREVSGGCVLQGKSMPWVFLQ